MEWLLAIPAVLALIPSYVAMFRLRARADEADKRADRVEGRADEALEQARKLTGSVDRIGDIMATRTSGRSSVPVEFEVERRKGSRYVLRNVGSEEATGVSIVDLPGGLITRNLPEGVTLGPLQSHEIFLGGSWQVPVPSEIQVECDQLKAPAFVAVPPRF